MVLGLSKNGILSTPMKVFFIFFLAARHPADFDGCPTAGAKALASVSLIPWHPCHSRPALHRRVPFLRCEHSISVSARHFLVVLHIETRVTRFRWRSVCLSVCLSVKRHFVAESLITSTVKDVLSRTPRETFPATRVRVRPRDQPEPDLTTEEER